jgi:hypothetical protein
MKSSAIHSKRRQSIYGKMDQMAEVKTEIQAAKKDGERQLKPYDYKLDGLDNDGKKIVKIYAKALGYVVYRTDKSIRLDIDDDHPKLEEYADNHYKLGIQLAKMYSLLPEDLSSTESINRLVARAMAMNVAGHCDDAKIVLKHAEKRLVKLKTIKGRLQYTESAFFLAVLIYIISILPCFADYKLFLQVVVCGALGGVLSIVIGYRSLNIDIDADPTTNRLIGMSRIIIAAIASIFIYFAIKSKMIFAFIDEQPDYYGLYTFAMVAGFIEMFVPNIMNNLAKDTKISQDENVGSSQAKLGPGLAVQNLPGRRLELGTEHGHQAPAESDN